MCNQSSDVASKAIPGGLDRIDLVSSRCGQISRAHEPIDDVARKTPIAQFNDVAHQPLDQ